MAYRFATGSGYMEFATGPLAASTFGPLTAAFYLKRNVVGTGREYVFAFTDSTGITGSFRLLERFDNDVPRVVAAAGTAGATTLILSDSSIWYRLVFTRGSGTVTPRWHLHDGIGWTHQAAGGTQGDSSLSAGDRMFLGNYLNADFLAADVVCAGFKKADTADLAVEALSATSSFPDWTGFGFDWLIRCDNIATRTNVASPGSGDEISRTGITLVADPAGWSWTLAVTPVADFTGTPLTGLAPLSVAFTNLSTG